MPQLEARKAILDELKLIHEDIEYIKTHMIDADSVLTPQEEVRLDQSLEEFKNKKSTSIGDLKKELGD